MNRIILAPAGGRKTQRIVDACAQGEPRRRRLVITYTQTAQAILRDRLYQACAPESMPEVMGWYGFLLAHVVRPYVPCWEHWISGMPVSGLHFVEGQDPTRGKRGASYYVDPNGKAYSNRLGKLAHDIINTSNGAVIDRLERIYDEIYIDEVQDLVGNDLDIFEILIKSKIDITLVGDVRQSTLQTSASDQKHKKKYGGLKKIQWFRDMETKYRSDIKLDECEETWRSSQEIIDLADSIFQPGMFSPTRSHQKVRSDRHAGLFLVSWDDICRYVSEHCPACYRHSKSTKVPEGVSAINFRMCKGETVDHALIFPTGDMCKFLKGQQVELNDDTRVRFYIAVSRAKYSVAFAVSSAEFARHKDKYSRLRLWPEN